MCNCVKFADDVAKLLELIDLEMAHGRYHTPDIPPYQYDDEKDYYKRHDDIVKAVLKQRKVVEKFIKDKKVR